MATDAPADVTQILRELRAGDGTAHARLMAAVYADLRATAGRLMRRERESHTLQATALVNEAYLRMVGGGTSDWKDRAHFLATAAQVMRHILIDHARGRQAQRRGGGSVPLSLDDALVVSPEKLDDLIVLDDALRKLEAEDERAARVIVMRFYGGLSIEEIAEVLGLSTRSVKRDWNFGKAWLRVELERGPGDKSAKGPGHGQGAV